MRQGCGAALGLLAFSATAMSGCAHGADVDAVLGRSLLAIPFFYIAGWWAGGWLEKMAKARSDVEAEKARMKKAESVMSDAGVEGEAR